MKLVPAVLLVSFLALACTAFCRDPQAEFRASIQDTDEIKVVATDQPKERQYHSVATIGDGAKLAGLLVFRPISPESVVTIHKCSGDFAVIFLSKGNEVTRASFAHGHFHLGLTTESEAVLIDFLEAKGLKIKALIAASARSSVPHD